MLDVASGNHLVCIDLIGEFNAMLFQCCKEAVTVVEALNSLSKQMEGSVIPKQPSLAGSAISLLKVLFSGERPVIDGIKLD